MDLSGQQLNDYRLLRQLGRGAMATVYLAEQQSLARRVAVKVLNEELSRDQDQVERFAREARAAASMTHPGVVQVHEVGSSGPLHFLVQEYLPGGSLGELLKRQGRFTPGAVLGVMVQVAEALDEAHSRGLVHRDIKPDNLMLDRGGAVKVADFGLARIAEAGARMTREGIALGTPLYMSPEQVEARPVDTRSDLYSLGVTAFHLLTGAPPFEGDTPLAVAMQHVGTPPPAVADRDPTAPASLAGVIDRLLAKDPAARYASPRELLGVLRQVADQALADGWCETLTTGAGRYPVAASHELSRVDLSAERALLGRAMRGERGGVQKRAATWIVAIVAGALLGGVVFRPAPLLPSLTSAEVAREPSVARQLLLAKRIDTPEAWRAIERHYPDADEVHRLLAVRGLAAALLDRDRNRQAELELRRLGELGSAYDEFAAFSHAGLAIAYARGGRLDAAKTELERLGDATNASVAQLADELRRVRERLRAGG
ncbi:MAG: serine/threonine-protein kinase [Planctomycetota bacterium]